MGLVESQGGPESGVCPRFSGASGDHVTIRGRRLALTEIVDPDLFESARVHDLRARLRNAHPFGHVVLQDAFNPTLLELVDEEFDLLPDASWQVIRGPHERTRRSKPGPPLGPAAALYFGIVTSSWFLDLLSAVTGVANLIADPALEGGGLHETLTGGAFDVHCDFDRHARFGFPNEMVFITYLNKGWQPSWGGALLLWDEKAKCAAQTIGPTFARSLLMLNAPNSYHGHPVPWAEPTGRPRRSLAAYYYSSDFDRLTEPSRRSTTFLTRGSIDAIARAVQRITPPLIWDQLRKIARMP